MEDSPIKILDFPEVSDAEIKNLALDLISDKIFTHCHMDKEDDLPKVFMPIALGAFHGVDDEGLKDIGLIYEYMDKAGPRAINGSPSFMSMKYLSKTDTERLFQKAKEMTKVIDNIQ